MRKGRLAWSAVLMFASAAPAAAQPKGAPVSDGRFRLGPVRVTPRIELRNAGVDTNVFNSVGAVPDTSVVLRTQLDGYLPVRGRLRLYGSGYTDFNYFRRESSERSTDFGGNGHAEMPLGPLVLFGGGGGGQARQRATIDIDERVLRQEKTAYVGAETHLGSRITVWGQGAGTVSRYGRTFSNAGDPFRLARGLDRNTLTATGELRLRLSTLTELVARGEAVEDRFLQQADAGRVTRSYRVLGGFRFDALAVVNGTVLAGFREIPRSSSGSLPPYRGPIFQADTGIPLFGRARLGLTGQRDIVFAATGDESGEGRLRNTYVSTRVTGAVELGLPLDLRLRTSAGFEEARYVLPYTMGSRSVRRADHLYTLSGSLLRQVGDSFGIGGTVTFTAAGLELRGLLVRGLPVRPERGASAVRVLDSLHGAGIMTVDESNMHCVVAMRKLIGIASVIALVAASALPAPAAESTATLWGIVPDAMRVTTSEVVTQRVGGEKVTAMPAPTDGRFTFANLAAGDYVVRLMGPTGETVAQSQIARVQPAESVEAVFEESRPSPGVVFEGGAGPSKALLIVSGAAVAGVATVLALTAGDEPPASPSR